MFSDLAPEKQAHTFLSVMDDNTTLDGTKYHHEITVSAHALPKVTLTFLPRPYT